MENEKSPMVNPYKPKSPPRRLTFLPEQEEPFWMVYGGECRTPVRSHGTEESAWEEVKRIARQQPGCDVYLLKAVKRVRAVIGFETAHLI